MRIPLTIGPAHEADGEALDRLLAALGFDDPQLDRALLRVAREGTDPVGVALCTDCGAVSYLGYVGVDPRRRGEGIATQLLADLLASRDRPVYCYTVIPDFFRRLGFHVGKPHPAIPTREENDCEGCDPARCTCMVWRPA